MIRTAILVSLAGATANADVITIKNTSGAQVVLSDLIVWDKDGNQEVILKPGFGNDESADDQTLGDDDSRVFTTDLVVEKYFVSMKSENSESEWKKTRDVEVTGAQAAAMQDLDTGLACHIEVLDERGAMLAPPVGEVLFFERGFSPDAPGWFVGSFADLDTGEILEPFTGLAVVTISGVEVTDIDECAADLDGDGRADANDFFLYLDLFASGSDRADIDGNGVIDAEDFFGYLDLFAQRCE